MSTRRAPQATQKKTKLENVGARVRQRAMSGSEASTVGFILVLYVFAGAGLGYLADQFLETNWIVAAGVLLGSALGFREMFRMIAKISRIEESANDAPVGSEIRPSASVPQFSKHSSSSLEYSRSEPTENEIKSEPHEDSGKPRSFHVPPPPTASFDNPDKDNSPR